MYVKAWCATLPVMSARPTQKIQHAAAPEWNFSYFWIENAKSPSIQLNVLGILKKIIGCFLCVWLTVVVSVV